MPSGYQQKPVEIAAKRKSRPDHKGASARGSAFSKTAERRPRSRWDSRGPLLLIVVVTLFTFSRMFTAEFTTWDDDKAIYQNPTFTPPTLHSLKVWWTSPNIQMWNPLTETMRGMLALCTTSSVDPLTGTRLNPYVFHANNVILHVLTTLIVYQVLRLLGFHNWPACCGALLFGVHPMQVEPVAWVTASKDTLCGILSLSAIWALLRANGFSVGSKSTLHNAEAPKTHRFYFTIATTLFVLATLSKPTAVALPLIALPLLFIHGTHRAKTFWMQMALWIVLAAPIMTLTKYLQPALSFTPVDYWRRPLVAVDALAFYVYKLFWPATLAIDYGRRPGVIFQSGWVYWTWLLPASVTTALLIFRRRARVLCVGALVFLAPLVPVLGLVSFEFQIYSTVADRYLYLSFLGVAISCSWILERQGRIGFIIAGVLIVMLAGKSWTQTQYWHDSWSLFSHAEAVNPTSPTAMDNLAVYYDSIGDVNSALRYLHCGIAARPDMTDFYPVLALAELKAGNWDAALEAYRTGYAIDPDKMSDDAMLQASKYAGSSHYELAIQYARIAIALRPDAATTHLTLGTVLAQSGDRKAALPELRKAAELDPSNFAIQCNLATVLAQHGDLDEARSHYQRALMIQPNSREAIEGLEQLRRVQNQSGHK